MSEDASYYEMNPAEPRENTCRAIVKYTPPEEIYWTLEDLQFLHAIGVSHE